MITLQDTSSLLWVNLIILTWNMKYLFILCYFGVHFEIVLQVSPDCKYLQTTVTFEIGKEVFTAGGKRLLSPGYTSVMSWQAIPSDENIPSCTVGEEYNIAEVP